MDSRALRHTLLAATMATVLGACAPVTTQPKPDSVQSGINTSNAPLNYKANAPQRYTVQSGDTLWSISSRYLSAPYNWKRLWRANPNIKNPHRIYPGDELVFVDGGLMVARRGTGAIPTYKLKPGVREMALDLGIPALPRSEIEGFLSHSLIMMPSEFATQGYMLDAQDSHLIASTTNRIYARGAPFIIGQTYGVFREEQTLVDPKTGDAIGIQLTKGGDAYVERDGDPATLMVVDSRNLGMRPGDRLIPLPQIPEEAYYFDPQPAPQGTEVQILGSPTQAVSYLGTYQTAILSGGFNQGLQPGHVVLVKNQSSYTEDPRTGERVELPEETAAMIMIYKVFDRTSYGLIMESVRPVKIGDWSYAPRSGRYD